MCILVGLSLEAILSEKENNFPSWIERVIGTNEVEYYELNDRFTLALVQG